MLDIKFIKDKFNSVIESVTKRNVKADPKLVIELYDRRNAIQQRLDEIRNKKNDNANKMKGKRSKEERDILIEEGKEFKTKITVLEIEERELDIQYKNEAMKLPNLIDETVPAGGEADSIELYKVGKIREFDFTPKDHYELGVNLNILDFESATSVSGQKFYYLKNEGALLELALINYAMNKLWKKGFTPYITPDLAKTSIIEGLGFNPRGNETNIYSIKDSDLCLIGTAEITIGGLNHNKILLEDELPLKIAGFSHCFRTEAGAAGLSTKGLYRVHQFSKVEMFIICHPNESKDFLENLRDIEEEIFKELGIPYRVLNIAAGDLGNPAYKKYDLEAWMPGRGSYGEVTSTSNCTDYQSRRLNIRYKDNNGKNQFVHMLNGTAIAVPRAIISILENFQNKDGSVDIPKVLVPFTGFEKIGKN